MNKRFLIKLLTMAALILSLMIPLSMIEGAVSSRTAFREQAKTSIAESWTGLQSLLGPILVQPYVEYTESQEWDENVKAYRSRVSTKERLLFVLPDDLRIEGEVNTEERRRGLYAIPVYDAGLRVTGAFSNQAVIDLLTASTNRIELKRPYLSVVVSDIRGIVTQPVLTWNDRKSEFVSGAALGAIGSGMRAAVSDVSTTELETYQFAFGTHLHGMESVQFSPAGKNTVVQLGSDWMHPSFDGRLLPSEHKISQAGFSATWRASSFSSGMERIAEQCQHGDCDAFSQNTFGVSLITPVDIYQQAERSVKYAVLFIALTFVVFFLFEVMKSLRLHPMQYLLVGASLTVFYLLLVATSEHIAFAWSYLISVVANLALVYVYIGAVLRSRMRALGLTAMLAALYAMLYAILRSEDNALLMGAILIFGALAAVMIITRKLDWYSVSDQIAGQTYVKEKGVEKVSVSGGDIS